MTKPGCGVEITQIWENDLYTVLISIFLAHIPVFIVNYINGVSFISENSKEGNVLYNDILNTF